jgi:hypothetical protein
MLKRAIASALDVALIVLAVVLIAKNGVGSNPTARDLLLLALVFSAPIVSLLVLWMPDSDDWISLYFRRKAMEERNASMISRTTARIHRVRDVQPHRKST